MRHFSLYRKSLHEEDIEKRRISKLQRSEHQKAKRRMGIGKQIEKVRIRYRTDSPLTPQKTVRFLGCVSSGMLQGLVSRQNTFMQ